MPPAPSTGEQPLLSFSQARALVEQHARQLPVPKDRERLPLLECAGRVLADTVTADRDLPPFPRATRDGYAVRSADLRRLPAQLNVLGELRAGGDLPAGFTSLAAGEALAIMTGAPVPAGADAVVMVEYTARPAASQVVIQRSVAAGENVVPRGSEAIAGAPLLNARSRLGPGEIALAASVGRATLEVFARPNVAILPTGDEIVPIDRAPAANQIRNSNSYSLAAQVAAAGAEPRQLPIAPDEPNRLRELIAEGLEADLLLISGGVSAGEYDLVEPALAEFHAEFFFTGALIQPGRPLVFGRATARTGKRTYFFGLPGNPVSTMVCFELFARALLDSLAGSAPRPLRFAQAHLAAPFHTKTGLTRFLPALLRSAPHSSFASSEVELVKWQGSGDLVAQSRANCYVVVPPEKESFAAGESVSVLLR